MHASTHALINTNALADSLLLPGHGRFHGFPLATITNSLTHSHTPLTHLHTQEFLCFALALLLLIHPHTYTHTHRSWTVSLFSSRPTLLHTPSRCVCVCVCVYVHTHTHACTHTANDCAGARVCVCVYLYLCLGLFLFCACARGCVCASSRMYACTWCVFVCVYVCVCCMHAGVPCLYLCRCMNMC